MPEQTLFYVVFSSQVLLISFFLPSRVLRLMKLVVETYPPSKYPRLYAKPIDYYQRAQRGYRNMNYLALLVGVILVVVGINSSSEEMLNWDTYSVTMIYWALQYLPLLLVAPWGFVFFSPKRKTDSATTRKADLRPRRLFDFVSPTAIGLALLVYVAFVVLILYLRQFDFPWFGGYANIVGITAMNLGLAAIAFRYLLYGKKKDPYQTSDDRLRVIELSLKLLVFVSIIATLFVTLAISLRALDLPSLMPVAQSLYLQLIAVIVFREFRIDNVDFEVYKEDPLAV